MIYALHFDTSTQRQTGEGMLRIFAITLAVVGTLVGCAPATMQEIREKPKGEVSFRAAQSYQSVYRTILSNARRCYQSTMIGAQMIVQGDLYTDTRTAEVVLSLHGALGANTLLGIDIKAISDDLTEVKAVSGTSNLATARAVQAWVENKSDSCRA